jgi:hypothetical protein
MQERESAPFERLFRWYPGAPPGEPKKKDLKEIQLAIKRHGMAKYRQRVA